MSTEIPTPRSDALFDQFGPTFDAAPMAYFSLCRELERDLKTVLDALARDNVELGPFSTEAVAAARKVVGP